MSTPAPTPIPAPPSAAAGVRLDDAAAQAQLFDPPAEHWQRLSPRYLPLRRLHSAITWGVPGAALALVLGFTWTWWAALAIGVLTLVTIGVRWWRMPVVVAAWGFAERATDLYVRSGVWQRRLVAVPYGRMQMVEVTSGPIERRFGLATVKLVTAAAHTDADIPGLTTEDATVLRDRLAERGEHQSMGL